jgi:tetratricopeptide (TPR) repeat protein
MAKRASARLSQSAGSIGQALTLHRAGRFDEAERIYDAILAIDPRDFEALHFSGVLKHQQGRSADALRLVAAALRARPGSADALVNYGVILETLQRHEDALASFDRALTLGADQAALHFNRGNVLHTLARYAEALASYDAALALAPELADAHYHRGNTLAALDRHADALASYDRALVLAASRADILANRGAVLLELECTDAALESLDRALALDPDNFAALNNRGNALGKLERYGDALASYERALALRPDDADALSNRGLALSELGRYDDALADYARALALAPDFIPGHLKRGHTLVRLARMADALASFGAAIALNPRDAEANFNAALARLCLGDFGEGWKQYEYRWERKKYAVARPSLPRPLWRGEEDLRGQTILLTAEQGLGDAIQFARYAPLVAARGAKVVLAVHRPLKALMQSVPGVAQIVADDEALPAFDHYCPLPSLPLAFDTVLATIPAQIPYLWPQQERLARWRDRLPQTGRLRVGICWAGNRDHQNDRRRSIPLERFAEILSVPSVDFVSLQKAVGAPEAAVLRACGVAQLGGEFADFSDTAAVVAMLDLVIAVDTSVAHLAGAMGKAVGLLVPFSPDFRWLLERTDSPWYPTMRLFRQSAIDDWQGPLDRVRGELADLARQPMEPRR